MKLVTAAMALATQGPDSEVVRLSVKAFRKHFTLLGGLMGLNSLSSSPSYSDAMAPGVTVAATAWPDRTQLIQRAVLLVAALVTIVGAITVLGGAAAVKFI